MKRLLALAAALIIAGCGTVPIERHSEIINGVKVDFRDADDGTCPCQGTHLLGYEDIVRDTQTIWLSRIAGSTIRRHEIAHLNKEDGSIGMRHTTFGWLNGQWCATVINSGGGYFVGQKICNFGNEETVF